MQHVDYSKSRVRTKKLCIKNSGVEIPVSKKFKYVISERLALTPANWLLLIAYRRAVKFWQIVARRAFLSIEDQRNE